MRQRFDAERKLIVGLIGQVIIETCRFDNDARLVSGAGSTHELDGGSKVFDIQANTQRLRQLGFCKVQANFPTLLLDIGTYGSIRQGNHHISFALLATLKINIADGFVLRAINLGRRRHTYGWGRSCNRSCSGTIACTLTDQHIEVITLSTGAVWRQTGQVNNQAGSIFCLNHRNAASITYTQLTIL
ncbi:hypothetical protein D9M68_740300 [compost metagenome]